jgi:hypothetical protein
MEPTHDGNDANFRFRVDPTEESVQKLANYIIANVLGGRKKEIALIYLEQVVMWVDSAAQDV